MKTATRTDAELAAIYNERLTQHGDQLGAREMAELAGFTSPSSGHVILVRLEALGLIPGRRRAKRQAVAQ